MKVLGLVGGTGWVSTLEYYRIINEETGRRLGGLEAARILLVSLNYGDVNRLNQAGDLGGVFSLVARAVNVLQEGGAEGILLCANTLHRFADDLERELTVPLLHIADATAKAVKGEGLGRVGLLGTMATMEEGFYRDRLRDAGIEALVPGKEEREYIHSSIHGELLKGRLLPETKERFLRIIGKLKERGAGGVILGCTEIPLLIKQKDADLPLFDTLAIHSRYAVDFSLGGT